MNKYFKKITATLLVCSFYISSFTYINAYASENVGIVSETFDGYSVSDENLMASGDIVSQGGIYVSPTVDVAGRSQPYNVEENGVYIVDDETGNGKGAVMKLVSDNNSVYPMVNYYKPMQSRAQAYAHETGKLLSVGVDMYFDRDTVFGYKLSTDNRSKYELGTWPCLTHVNMGFLSIMGTSSFATRHSSIATLAFDNSKAASWTDNSYIPVFINTRGKSDASENANSMATSTAQFTLPTGEWFRLSILFDLNNIDASAHKVPISVYVNDECKLSNYPAIVPLGNDGYEFEKVYRGLVFSPQAYVADDNRGDVKPVMYVDDIDVSYLTEYIPDVTFELDGQQIDASEVSPNSTVCVTFEDDIPAQAQESLLSDGFVKVYDELGNNLALTDVSVIGNVMTFKAADGFAYNRKYTLEVAPLDMYNGYFVKFNGLKTEFYTEKSKGAYIVSSSLTSVGSGAVDTASQVVLNVETSEPTAVIAAAFLNGIFKNVQILNTAEEKSLTFEGPVDYVKLIVSDSDRKSVCDTVILNPLGKEVITDNDYAGNSEVKLTVSDAKNSVIKLSGSTGKTGNNQYGRIEIYTEKKDNYADNVISDAVFADDISVNEKGQIADTFAFKRGSGAYYAWIITNDATECIDFEYVSYSDLIDLIRRLAITDSSAEGYISKGNVYDEVEKRGYGFGIDFEKVYTSSRDKELFAYRLDKARASLIEGTENDYIGNFTDVEKDIEKEISFLRDLENPVQKAQIEYLLKSNTDITGMDFSDYSSVPSEVYDKFLGKTFANADEVKPFFETELNKILKDRNDSKGGGSSGGSKSSKSSTITADQMKEALDNAKTPQGIGFKDLVSVPWAEEAITSLYNKKIINGISNSEFAPSGSVTREEFIKMLVLAAGSADFDAECNFADISESDWSYSYVAAGVKAGIVNGIDENNFGGKLNISRQDVAVMIYRIINKSSEETDVADIKNNTEIFADIASVSDYALLAVKSLKDNQLISGRDGNIFAPLDNMTRAEAAVIINRLIDYLGK